MSQPVHRAGAPIFGEWNVNGPSADYGFTQAFGQVRDRKKTSTTPVAATEAPTTPSYNSENLNTNRRFKVRCSLGALHFCLLSHLPVRTAKTENRNEKLL